jgi:biopolymer transport protein ExbD/biopolymer transport protein TolR
MAISVRTTGSSRRGRGLTPLAEINVIPLVDVVLVLLIIFMLTAHVMEFGLEVDVPKVRQTRKSADQLPVVTITKDGEMQLNEKPVNINDLAAEFRKRFPNDKSVYVRADKSTIWDPIAQVISTLGEAKIDVRVVTQPDDAGSGRK